MEILKYLNLHTNTIKKLDIWMNCHPDSVHPNDKERFMDLIREADKNDDLDALLNLDMYQVVKTYRPLWIEDYVHEFILDKKRWIAHEVEKCKRKKSKSKFGYKINIT